MTPFVQYIRSRNPSYFSFASKCRFFAQTTLAGEGGKSLL